MLKDWKVWLLAFLVLASLYLLFSSFMTKERGVVVVSISTESKCGDLKEGDIITEVSGFLIEDSTDFENAVERFKAGEYATLVVNGGPGGCVAIRDGDLGIKVKNAAKAGLRFGPEIGGLEVSVLKPEKNLTQAETEKTLEILRERAGIAGFPGVDVRSSDGKFEITSLPGEDLRPLLSKGKFEAKILEEIKIENASGKIPVGEMDYEFVVEGKSIRMDNSTYTINQTFELGNISFELLNITNSSVVLQALVFTNEDVKDVLLAYSFVTYNPSLGGYEFYLPLEISEEASERIQSVIKRMETRVIGGRVFLAGSLVFYLDGKSIGSSPIPFDWIGREINRIAVAGYRGNQNAALSDKLRIQLALQTENLPVELEIEEVRKEEVGHGSLILYSFLLLFFLLIAGTSGVSYKRYKSSRLSFYLFLLLSSQLIIIFGSIALVQRSFPYAWLIGVESLTGILSSIILASLHLFAQSERALRKREFSIFYKYKRIKLFPLTSILAFLIGFVLLFWLKGFALSLIIGSLLSLFPISFIYSEKLKSI